MLIRLLRDTSQAATHCMELSVFVLLYFFITLINSGAQIRCAQTRYTVDSFGLDQLLRIHNCKLISEKKAPSQISRKQPSYLPMILLQSKRNSVGNHWVPFSMSTIQPGNLKNCTSRNFHTLQLAYEVIKPDK